MYLTSDQVAFFHREGYLVLEGFWTAETVGRLKSKIGTILSALAPADNLDNIKSVFNTVEQERKTDNYFLESGDKIRFFWEAGAKDSEGNLVQPAEECVNKVGHALHDLDPDFEQVSYEERVGKICRDLGLVRPLAVQSMYIFKQAHIGGEVVPHQDGAFLYTEPQSVVGFWWPLDDCLQTNGCLWAVPGSHTAGVTRRFKRKDPPGEGTEFVPKEPVVWDLDGAVPLETLAGSLVLIHHSLVHYSSANTSPKVNLFC